MKIYLANDLGFNTVGAYWLRVYFNRKLEEMFLRLRIEEYEIFEPFDDNKGDTWERIADNNETTLFESDVFVGISEGQSFDSGVAAEIGMSYVQNPHRPIFVMRSDGRAINDHPETSLNLQVQNCVCKTGGSVVDRTDDLIDKIERYIREKKESEQE